VAVIDESGYLSYADQAKVNGEHSPGNLATLPVGITWWLLKPYLAAGWIVPRPYQWSTMIHDKSSKLNW